MDKKRNFYKDTYHHLYNRGVNKNNIFFEKENYLFFLKKMKFYKTKYNISILTYCLMPNHFHLFLKQQTEEFSISAFISSLLNSYTKSINKRYKRSGTLFESKTKSKEITDENYFMWVIKYILDNPVKANLVNQISEWEFSNAKDLLKLRDDFLTDREEVLSFFQSEGQMINFLAGKNLKNVYKI